MISDEFCSIPHYRVRQHESKDSIRPNNNNILLISWYPPHGTLPSNLQQVYLQALISLHPENSMPCKQSGK